MGRDSVRQRVKYWRNRVKQVEKEENRVRDNETERRHRGKSVNYGEDIGDETEKKTGKEASEETGRYRGKVTSEIERERQEKARKDKERQVMSGESETL